MRTEARDRGLLRLSRLTRWIAAGGIAVAGVFTALVARAQPGKTATTQPSQSTPVTTQVPPDESISNGGTPGLQAPTQAPTPTSGSGRAVSGGS